MPAALVLPTPAVDLTESGDTFQTLDGVHGGVRSQMAVNLLYANGHDLAEPYLSPLFADLSGFPPTFLQSGTRDLFLSNTVRMHRKLLAAGVEPSCTCSKPCRTGIRRHHAGGPGARRSHPRFLDKHRRAS